MLNNLTNALNCALTKNIKDSNNWNKIMLFTSGKHLLKQCSTLITRPDTGGGVSHLFNLYQISELMKEKSPEQMRTICAYLGHCLHNIRMPVSDGNKLLSKPTKERKVLLKECQLKLQTKLVSIHLQRILKGKCHMTMLTNSAHLSSSTSNTDKKCQNFAFF